MIDGGSGTQLDAYTLTVVRPSSGVDDLVEDLALGLRATVGRNLQGRDLRMSDVEEASRAFREGRQWARDFGWSGTPGVESDVASRALAQADTLFSEAAALDPDWVEPLVQRGLIAEQRAFLRFVTDRSAALRWIEIGRTHADEALRMEPGNAGALYLRGLLNYREAQIRTGPKSFRDSLLAAARLRRLAEQDAEAEEWCDEGRRRFPHRWEFVECRLRLMGWPARMGANDSARAVLERATEGGPPGLAPTAAGVWLLLDEHQRAVDLIRGYVESVPGRVGTLRTNRILKPLRDDPRFVAILQGSPG